MRFDQSLKNELTFNGEAIRLYNEIMGEQKFKLCLCEFWAEKPKQIPIKKRTPVYFTTEKGIDMLNCEMSELIKYKPKSSAQKKFKETMIKIRTNQIKKNELIELGKSGISKNSKLYFTGRL